MFGVNLTFEDFSLEEGVFRGPWFVRVPEFVMGSEVGGRIITRGRERWLVTVVK